MNASDVIMLIVAALMTTGYAMAVWGNNRVLRTIGTALVIVGSPFLLGFTWMADFQLITPNLSFQACMTVGVAGYLYQMWRAWRFNPPYEINIDWSKVDWSGAAFKGVFVGTILGIFQGLYQWSVGFGIAFGIAFGLGTATGSVLTDLIMRKRGNP